MNWRHSSQRWPRPEGRVTYPSSVTTPQGQEPSWWSATLHRIDTDRWGLRRGHARSRPHRPGSRPASPRGARTAAPGPAADDRRRSRPQPRLLPPAGRRCPRPRPTGRCSHAPTARRRRQAPPRRRQRPSPRRDPPPRPRPDHHTSARDDDRSGPAALPGSLGLHWVEVRWLEAGDNRIGILTIGARSKRRPPENDLTLLDAAAAQLGNALEKIERSPQFLRSRSLEVARVNADVGEAAQTQYRPPPTRARDPPPLRRRTPNRPDRRTTRTLPAHSPDTRQERSPPPWRQLPSRGTRPSQGCRRRSLHVTEGRLERMQCRREHCGQFQHSHRRSDREGRGSDSAAVWSADARYSR